jgi:hypothetical protein
MLKNASYVQRKNNSAIKYEIKPEVDCWRVKPKVQKDY